MKDKPATFFLNDLIALIYGNDKIGVFVEASKKPLNS
jgi:hypothetical protein